MIYNNQTNLEFLSNMDNRIPCYGKIVSGPIISKYDMLWYANFQQALGKHYWLWLIPIEDVLSTDGIYFP